MTSVTVNEQLEIDWKFCNNPLQTADNELQARIIVREVFRENGLDVTFNAKPIIGVAGSGEHKMCIRDRVKEAEAHAAEDKARKEELDIKNNADSLVYQAEKALKELDGKGDTTLLKEVEEAKDKLKKSIEAGNIDDIKKDSEALEQPLHKLAEQMYAAAQQAQQAAGGAEQGQQQTKADDNVVDADYTVVDDDKK